MVTLPRLNNATVDPERLKDALKGLVPEQPSGTHFRYPAEDTKAYAIKWLEELRKKKSGATRPSRRRKKDDGDAVSDGAAVTDVGTANIGDPHEDGDLNGEAAPDNAKAANDEEAVGESDATRQSGAVNDHAKHRAEGQPDMSTSSSATRSHKRGRGGHNQFNELTGTSAGREENADTPTDRWPVKKKRKTRHSSTSPTPDDRQASSSRDGGWTDGAVEVNGVSQSACNQRTVHAQEIVASSTGDTVVPITESANGSSSRVTTLTGPSSMVSHTGGVNGVVAQTETAAAATTPVANSVLPTKAMAPISHFVLADSNANSGKPSTARGVFRVPNVDFNSYTPRATCDDKTALGTFGTAEPTATWGSSSIWPTNVRRETGAGLNDLTGTSTPSILSTSAWLMSSKGSLPPSTGDAPKASATPPNGNANTTGERTAVPTTHRSHNGDDSDSRAAMHQAVQHHRTLIAHYLARYGDLQAELTDLEATMERLQMEARDQICSVVDCMRMEERATKQPYGQYRSSDLPDPVIVHPRIIDTIRTEQAQVFNSQLERMCNGVEVELRRERYASTVKGKERSVD
ncbi:hypothetical protein C8Q80DRAFT_176224 [Daedaleopsis nitida]|nr:hypothetical protein C8Q80DRAFT_176224 [Daedaleopsis nitida]